MEQFQKGDVVRLNSGGPLMTITELGTGHENGAKCVWFDNKNLREAVFDVDVLKKGEAEVVPLLGPIGIPRRDS